MHMAYSIALIGCGKMGSAMLDAWIKNNLISYAKIIDPSPPKKEFSELQNVSHALSYENEKIEDDILILAVKPQILKDACARLSQNISKNTTIISIAAGQSLENLEEIFGRDRPIIRVMPNTPAAIGKGMNVAVANASTSEDQKNMATDLLKACGSCEWLKEETLMDAVTALSGSGPAYIFYLIEMLAKAGGNLGLPESMAMTLARQTVIGSAALAEAEPNIEASQLRTNVTSPGGTTQAALEIMMDGRMQEIMSEALNAGKKRSEELKS